MTFSAHAESYIIGAVQRAEESEKEHAQRMAERIDFVL